MKLSLITTHFHDFGWTDLCVHQVVETTPSALLCEILIVDQDRNDSSRSHLQALDDRVRVLQYPRSEQHCSVTGHDHAHVLNQAVSEARGTHVCILDSDAHPISACWVETCERLLRNYDAILAQDPRNSEFSHPCFMLLGAAHLGLGLKFDKDLFERNIDTGRLIAEQLRRAQVRVLLAPPEAGFGGRWGSLYMSCIYHHGQGSFAGGGSRLRSQLTWRHKIYRDAVVKDRTYHLKPLRLLDYCIRRLKYKLMPMKKLRVEEST